MSTEKLIDKVRKLLAKAEGTTNQNEADAFMAKANQLLVKHNLTMAQVGTQDESSIQEGDHISYGEKHHEEGKWEATLMGVIANANLTRAINHKSTYSNKGTLTVIGDAVNVETTVYMFNLARTIIRRLAREAYAQHRADAKSNYPGHSDMELCKAKVMQYRSVFLRSYLKGAVAGLHSKLQAEKRAMFQETAGMEGEYGLMVINNNAAIDKFLQDAYGKLGKGRTTRATNNAAYRAGREAGKNVSLNRGVGSNTGSLRLSA